MYSEQENSHKMKFQEALNVSKLISLWQVIYQFFCRHNTHSLDIYEIYMSDIFW